MKINAEKKILLVEDDYLNRRLTKKILSEDGYEVFEAKNASIALEILLQKNIDLVVLDIDLGKGEQDGISLGNVLREQFNIPFIYLSAYENLQVLQAAWNTSPAAFLTKPFNSNNLITALRVAFG